MGLGALGLGICRKHSLVERENDHKSWEKQAFLIYFCCEKGLNIHPVKSMYPDRMFVHYVERQAGAAER